MAGGAARNFGELRHDRAAGTYLSAFSNSNNCGPSPPFDQRAGVVAVLVTCVPG